MTREEIIPRMMNATTEMIINYRPPTTYPECLSWWENRIDGRMGEKNLCPNGEKGRCVL